MSIMNFIENIKRSFQYAVHGWNSRDYDYGYLLDDMEFKLKRLLESLSDTSNDTDAIRAKQIRYAIFLLKRVSDPELLIEKDLKDHEEKYGKVSFEFVETDIKGVFSSKMIYSKTDNHEEADQSFLNILTKQDNMKNDYKKRLFRHLDNYIEGWWT